MNNLPEPVIPNLIKPGLKVLFIGINPGLQSAALGHHFASHSNRFWRFLANSGLTPEQYRGVEDFRLLDLDYGITNIVSRPSAAASELTPHEFRVGAVTLKELLLQYQPRVAVSVGKVVYQYFSGKKDFQWGRQELSVLPGMIDFVLPNPSGLNRMSFQEQVHYYRELKDIIERDVNGRATVLS